MTESSEDQVKNEMGGVARTFRSLRYRNYRLYFAGQGISLIGTWMQQMAMSWLIYRLTGSALMLGVVSFAGSISAFLLTTFAGVVADRLNKYHILLVTQILAMLQALTLAAIVLTGSAQVWNLIIMSVILGTINAFDMPARQSFVIDMVDDKNDLSNAIALNSSLFNGARLIGPAVAGALVAAVGERLCFLINGISFIAVIACLLSMRLRIVATQRHQTSYFKGLKEGVAYAFGSKPIKYIILLIALSSVVAMPYPVLMPIFAKEVFQGGPNTLGLLMTATGLGALVGAIYLASRQSPIGLERVIIGAALIFGAGMIIFSRVDNLVLGMIAMALAGFGMVTQMASSNTILQTIADDDKRGRIMGIYVMAFGGLTPFGSLLAGSVAHAIGAPNTLLFGGICCILGGLVFAWKFSSIRESVWAAYMKK